MSNTENNTPEFQRFVVFSDNEFYPSGGIGGRPSFATLQAAIEQVEKSRADYNEIFDCEIRGIVWSTTP